MKKLFYIMALCLPLNSNAVTMVGAMTCQELMKTKFKSKTLLLTTGLAMMLLLSMPSRAGLEEADIAYNNKDYKTALKEYLPFAKQGNYGAQLKVGMIFFEGQGVVQDYEEGYYWLTQSADQGNPVALIYLAGEFIKGTAIKRNLIFAYAYSNLAEENKLKFPEYKESFENITKVRDGVGQNLTSSEKRAGQLYAKIRQKFAEENKGGLSLPNYDVVK